MSAARRGWNRLKNSVLSWAAWLKAGRRPAPAEKESFTPEGPSAGQRPCYYVD